MNKEQLERELKYTKEKHKNDNLVICTFETNISTMCSDVLDVLSRCIEIPDGATNRDIIKELWHDETLLSNIEYCYGKEWLNAPYNPPKQNLAFADKSGLEYADQPTLQSAT